MSALLCIDIGNSTIGLALFLNPIESKKLFIKKIPLYSVKPRAYKKIISEFINSTLHNPLPLKGRSLQTLHINAIISSVVPSLNKPIIKATEDVCKKKPLIVSHKLNCGLIFNMEQIEKIGSDRIANAIAGFDYFKRPVAVIDFGTATTITIVGRQNCHPVLLGGAIMPGINLMQRSLHEGTSKLPLTLLRMPKTILGKNTVSAITSGIVFGTAGGVEALIKGMEKELNFRLKLILTGGHAQLMSPIIKRNHYFAPNLIFEGLRLIYIKARSSHA